MIQIIIIAGLKSHMIQTSRKSDKEESIDLSDMPPLGSVEEEVNKGKGVKMLAPNKLLTRLPVLIAQIKGRKNSWKLKHQIRQILYLCVSIISHYNNGKKI